MSDSIRADIEAAMKESDARKDEDVAGSAIDNTTDEEEDEDEDLEVPKDAGKADEESEDEKDDSEPATDAPAKETTESKQSDEPASTWDPEKAPTSWSPKVREQWKSLPEEVRKEIVRREEASVVGVRKLQEDFQPIRQFAEGLSPFIQEARQLGVDPGQYMQNVMAAERNLRSQDPNQKFNALLSIADSYGIPLRQYLGGEAPKGQPQQPQIAPAVQQELEAMRKWRQEQEQNTLVQQVESFKQGKEFFEDVRGKMADLIDSGVAKTLEEAYDVACWANPEVREVLLSRKGAEEKKSDQSQRRANATKASVKGSSGAEVTVDTDDDDSTEAIIRKAMTAQSGRL